MSNQAYRRNRKLLFKSLIMGNGITIHPYYRRAVKSPAWLLMYIFGRFSIFRSLAKLYYKNPDKQKHDLSSSVFKPVDTEVITQNLRNDGFWGGIKLPEHILQAILKYTATTECYANSRPDLGFKISQKNQAEQKCQVLFNQAQYLKAGTRCPAIKELASDPMLLEIANKYLGTKAILTGTRLWWIFPVDEEFYNPMEIASFFHYDMDDYHSVRFFFYLTDVDLNSGPHLFVRGSHRKKRFTNLLSSSRWRSDEDIVNYYGEENIVTICGEAGFGFVEDTFSYHKATRPTGKRRLVLQLQYTVNDFGVHQDTMDASELKNILDT